MAYILSYTKTGIGTYAYNVPYEVPETAYNCDWEHSMHLAISDDGINYTALRNNTGILFPKCSFAEGNPMGVTKTLQDPWIFRMADGTFGVAAVRRNQNAPDPFSVGCMMLFTSKNLVRYEANGFLKLSDGEIKNPRCRWEAERNVYYVEWETKEGVFCGCTKDFKKICEEKECENPLFENACDYGIENAVPGNVIEVSDAEADYIRKHFDVIYNIGVMPMEVEANVGEILCFDSLPKATMCYSDGSTHKKMVEWDKAAFAAIDFMKPGEYKVPGEVQQKVWPFPMPLSCKSGTSVGEQGGMSDPCVTYYAGKYYLTSSGGNPIVMRVGNTIEEAFAGKVIEIPIQCDPEDHLGTWAAELHIIKDVPYLFVALCSQTGQSVRAHVLRCNGNPQNPHDWEQPRLCIKPNGNVLTEGGISLDMTYFCVEGIHYVMWSDRKVPTGNLDFRTAEPADIYIATVDPDAPWQCTSEPQCILRPVYGWDRYGTNVDEGPYLLRRGDDLFITISGSSTGIADLYNLGFLHAKVGNNLLTAAGWDWIPYPFLTKESVENQYGPGHNNFIKDPQTGDDLMVYHAVPHDADGKVLGRKPGIRRVHWAASGYPYLEMTKERDLNPKYKNVTMKITVK